MNSLFRGSRQAIAFLALAITLLFSKCESPLSDIEVTDPSVLHTNFVVERALLDDGTVLSSLRANIFDKNLASIELKNGQVKVNGQQMSITEILNISTYHIPSATVSLNTKYDFEVVLADGKSYPGTVTTQPKTFTSVTVPAQATVDNDLTIFWEEIYLHDEFIITMNLTSSTGTVAGPEFRLTAAQMQAGTFTIPKANFATPAGITSALITLTGVRYGTIDSEFGSASGTISRMRVEKKVVFE